MCHEQKIFKLKLLTYIGHKAFTLAPLMLNNFS